MSTSSISSNINNSFYVFVGSGSNSLSYYKQITNNNINENVNKIDLGGQSSENPQCVWMLWIFVKIDHYI